MHRPVIVDTLLPPEVEAFPWAGYLGLTMVREVIKAIDLDASTLLFANTRSQAERWFQALLEERPDWEPLLALHHSAIDRLERERIEAGLKEGSLRLVVCTSSLDLGVDFPPVERVIQVGSPKGVARLIQRAGRAAHRPGAPCHLLCVPTHGLQLIEIAAAKDALERGDLEPRLPLRKPLDVLAQHLVTCAIGGGFEPDALFDEVRRTAAYHDLTRAEFDRALELVREGGGALRAYPEYRRVVEVDGRFTVASDRLALIHRSNIGTITAETSMQLKFMNGATIGHVEESYVSRLKPGDRFFFAGKRLELVKVRDLAAWVRVATKAPNQTPRWLGGRLPLSTALADAVRRTLERIRDGEIDGPELEAALPIIDAQLELSALPRRDELLVELVETRDGHHCFLYPFEGRLVHEGLAAVLALRLTRHRRTTFTLTVNDYGIELLAPEPFPFREALSPALFSPERLLEDTLESVNLTELAKRQFRDVARISGLIFQSFRGDTKTARQLQASASLLFEVFQRYDPDNVLLGQAKREVMEQQFEQGRLRTTLERLERSRLLLLEPRRPTPLAFPLLVDRMSAHLSAETLVERIERMKKQWVRDETPATRAPKQRASSAR